MYSIRSLGRYLASVFIVRLLFLLWLAHFVFILRRMILFIFVLSSFWYVWMRVLARVLSSLFVLLRVRVLVFASSRAFVIICCFLFIHFWYFWSICSGFLWVFGSISVSVPVLYSSLGYFMLR